MRLGLLYACCLATFLATDIAVGKEAGGAMKMATTTSTDNSGLLEVLLPAFKEKTGLTVHVIAVGTGKALKLGENGDVDLVFVHARSAEDKFVENGFGVNRKDVMYNDFVILGPKSDPVRVGYEKTAPTAFSKIAAEQAQFISRGDESGTHRKEMAIWKAAGHEPNGKWYSSVGQGMAAVLMIASEKGVYTLADRGTFIALQDNLNLVVVFEGDKTLFNPYGIIAVNPKMHPHVKYAEAMKFIEWITSKDGQALIAGFKKKGKQLFYPSAK
jgi:tungstate transport system substrate-binding protein